MNKDGYVTFCVHIPNHIAPSLYLQFVFGNGEKTFLALEHHRLETLYIVDMKESDFYASTRV